MNSNLPFYDLYEMVIGYGGGYGGMVRFLQPSLLTDSKSNWLQMFENFLPTEILDIVE